MEMSTSDEKRFEPYTARMSTLWTLDGDAGSVESESEIPGGAEVAGYASPLPKGGFRVEWI